MRLRYTTIESQAWMGNYMYISRFHEDISWLVEQFYFDISDKE